MVISNIYNKQPNRRSVGIHYYILQFERIPPRNLTFCKIVFLYRKCGVKLYNTDRIFELKKEKGITTSFIISKIGGSRQRLYDWKAGKSEPSDKDLQIIADILDTTIEYLKYETDCPTKKEEPAVSDDSEHDYKIKKLIELMEKIPDDKLDAAITVLSAMAQ